jgi:hypothetical protein
LFEGRGEEREKEREREKCQHNIPQLKGLQASSLVHSPQLSMVNASCFF